jgi:hypothetical protein
MLGKHDSDAGLAVDAAASERDLTIELRGDRREGADMAGRDVGCVHGVSAFSAGLAASLAVSGFHSLQVTDLIWAESLKTAPRVT